MHFNFLYFMNILIGFSIILYKIIFLDIAQPIYAYYSKSIFLEKFNFFYREY